MAGSSGSGEDIEAGRTNDAESTTVIQAGRPSELDVSFNGIFTFEAGPRRDEQRPDGTLNGMIGRGWNGWGSPGQRDPGAGVIGSGAPNHGPGVVGLGGGFSISSTFLGSPGNLGSEGLGGTGVLGFGGPGDATSPAVSDDVNIDPPLRPGAGVVGQGGTSFFPVPADGSLGFGNGPGVVGLAGGLAREQALQGNLSQSDLEAMANVGVVGIGGDGTESVDPSGAVLIGPTTAGTGVRGIGGVAASLDPAQSPTGGPGVVGVAGGRAVPDEGSVGEVGVAGYGGLGSGVFGNASLYPGVLGNSDAAAGVAGNSEKGIGVAGFSKGSNGGYFASVIAAQLHLEPLKQAMKTPNGNLEGRAGDLLVLRTEEREQFVTLWFCRMGGDAASANWLQIA
jgi:hypothetical protein